MFQSVTCKIGNMRKVQDWTIYPCGKDPVSVTIQCDSRIAQFDLITGKMMLSSGKGGHQGFAMLAPFMGAKECVCPPEIEKQLREYASTPTPVRSLVTGQLVVGHE